MDYGAADRLRQVLLERSRRLSITRDAASKLDDIKTRIAMVFVFTGDRRHAVRVADMAKAIGLRGCWRTREMLTAVREASEALGGEWIRPCKRSIVRGCHLRGQSEDEAIYAGVTARRPRYKLHPDSTRRGRW